MAKKTKGTTLIFLSLLDSCRITKPTPEYKFHPDRNWRFDYAWPEQKIALEVEGGIWLSKHNKKSRHFTGAGAKGDMEKYNAASALGWRIVRVVPDELCKTKTVELLKSIIIST